MPNSALRPGPVVLDTNLASHPWTCPINLGPQVNTPANDIQAHLSDDAETLYYSTNRADGHGMDDIWLISRERRHGQN